CRLVVESESRPVAGDERGWVAKLVQEHVVDRWRHRDEPEHLRTIEARLHHAPPEEAGWLPLYRRILDAGGEIDAGDSPGETALLLSGVATRSFDKLRVGNPIYAAVFDERWAQEASERRRPSTGSLEPR